MPCLTNGVELLCHAMSPFPLLMLVAVTLEQNSAPSILEPPPSKLKIALFSSTPVLIGSNGVNGDTAWHCRCWLAALWMVSAPRLPNGNRRKKCNLLLAENGGKKRRGISAAFYAASARLEEKEGKGMESA